MYRPAALIVVAVLAAPLVAADKPDVDRLKKQIAETEQRLAELKAELAKAGGVPTEFREAKLYPKRMAAGDQGRIHYPPPDDTEMAVHLVVEVIDDTSFVMQLAPKGPIHGCVLVKEWPTKDMTDGQAIKGERVWQVLGTEKVNGRTMYVLREARAAVKGDEKKK